MKLPYANLFFFLRKKSKPSYSGKIYDSLDKLPVYNWEMMQKEGNVNYLLISTTLCKKDEVPKETIVIDEVEKACIAIYNEYFREFGQSDEYRKYLNLQQRYALAMTDFLIKQDYFLLNKIEVLKMELMGIREKKDREENHKNFVKTWAFVCSKLPYAADKKTMSTYNYLSILHGQN